jgi:hypothetical protein
MNKRKWLECTDPTKMLEYLVVTPLAFRPNRWFAKLLR